MKLISDGGGSAWPDRALRSAVRLVFLATRRWLSPKAGLRLCFVLAAVACLLIGAAMQFFAILVGVAGYTFISDIGFLLIAGWFVREALRV